MQGGLPGFDDAATERHRLFFALFPDVATRDRIEGVAAGLRQRHGLTQMIRPDRYHVTVHFLGDHSTLRSDLVDAAQQAAQRVRVAPFTLAFDALAGFGSRHNPAYALRASHVPAAAQAFWIHLRDCLRLAGLGKPLLAGFAPHITLAYSGRALATETVEPISLQAGEFVLVHSILGRTVHRELGRWPLTGA